METANAIVSVIDALCEKFGLAIEWTSDTISQYLPMILERFTRWQIGKDIFWMCFGLLILGGIGAILIGIGVRAYKKEEGILWQEDIEPVPIVFGILFLIAGLIVTAVFGYELVKVCTFPEIVLIDYVKGLIR